MESVDGSRSYTGCSRYSLLVTRYSCLPRRPGGGKQKRPHPDWDERRGDRGLRGTTQVRDTLAGIASAVRNTPGSVGFSLRSETFDTRACGNGGDPAWHQDHKDPS